jgi:hypothetical protein
MTVHACKTNQLYPTVGQMEGKAVLRWDPITLCNERCRIYNECPYIKKGRCSLERSYMNNIFNNIVSEDPNRGISDMLNDIELQRVGIHLIPLYHQLIRLKKEAFAVKQMVHENKQGSLNIHPVFKEIREVIRCISKEIKEIGINEKWQKKFGTVANIEGVRGDIETLLEQGDPDFYSRLENADSSTTPKDKDSDKSKKRGPGRPKKKKE